MELASGVPEYRPQISERTFVKGLLAALALRGDSFIITQANAHQKAFRRVTEFIESRQAEVDDAVQRLPRWFSEPITGVYSEFDDNLIELQNVGVTRCIGPYFSEVEICLTPERAEHILTQFSDAERELFATLANQFSTAPKPATAP